WDVATGREYATVPYVSEHIFSNTEDFALSKDGKILAFLDNSERLPMEVKTSRMVIDRQEIVRQHNASKGLPRVKMWEIPAWKEGMVQ
ncbi:MAG: hypothetical protein ACXVA6_20710, partial [Isosphaeraceae bacterium]